ncbi:MAG: 50S ribosomal protein L5 [Candidatus Aenigmarchaeota archaeon]|nr:50S ribosomal protein L5 [Candidatus Aenigmarchaeota archaeon]
MEAKLMQNAMREVRIEKVTLNIGVGEGGEKLQKGATLLNVLTGQKVYMAKAFTRTTFGTPKGRPIGAKVTVRGTRAEEFLKLALRSKSNKLAERAFDTQGNVSFGIAEHIDLPGVKYDPKIGIFGMDVCVTLTRPGYRVKKKARPTRVGHGHILTREEGIEFMRRKFGVEIS